MKNHPLFQRLENEILILDGAMGTMLQPHLPPGHCMDATCLTHPDVLANVHQAYAEAGSDFITTNTFGATPVKLEEFGLADKTEAINETAARLARKAVKGAAFVAGSIGPSGKLVNPLGDLSFDACYDAFRRQALALANGGVDLFLMETFADLKEARLAVMAVKEATNLPIMISMTFGEDFLTFTGTDPETAVTVLAAAGADVVGVNCSTGPAPMLEVVGRMTSFTPLPVYVEPNAGIPRLDGDEEVTYQVSPGEMGDYAEKYVQIGANIVGTCCGSTPEYTAELVRRLKGKRPLSRHVPSSLTLSSRTKTVQVGANHAFAIIGERINPTNRDELAQEILDGKVTFIQKEARLQSEQGAHFLDINIGAPGADEGAFMDKAVRAVESASRLPVVIDTTHPEALEAALRESPGKVLINSVNGDEKSLETVIPLAARYGAGLLCLAVSDKGIPATAEARLEVLKKIIARAEAAGIPRRDLICDCLTLTVSAQQKRAQETLRAVRMVKEELGLPTVLGLSNISFGLPERSLINATFLSMAMAAGLDAAIINPGDARMLETIRAASVLTVRDKDSRAFVKSHAKKKKKKKAAPAVRETLEESIYQAVISGNRDDIPALVETVLEKGKSPSAVNEELLIPAIQDVGAMYDRKEIFLPQMILAAETMQQAFSVLEPHFTSADTHSKGTVILCTVKGDVHDIGKNIVGLFLKNQGYDVVDLGKDVDAETIVSKAGETGADVIGLSALMTTTMTEMPGVIDALRQAGSKARIIVGGAVVTKAYARQIGADGYAKDGVSAVALVKSLINN